MMMAFNSMIFVSALIAMVAFAQAQPVNNQAMKNVDPNQDSPVLVPKGRDAYLVMKAYNALSEAGKALETLIELHGKKLNLNPRHKTE